MNEDLLKPEQVARYLGTTPGGLAQLRYRGCGPKFIKLGARAVRYKASDIEEWLNQNTHQQTGVPA